MKKRLLSSLIIICMAIVSLAACGSSDSSSQDSAYKLDKITMTVNNTLNCNEENGRDAFEEQWEEAVGVDLEILQFSQDEYEDRLEAMITSGEYPDVALMSSEMYAKYANSGYLWDMTAAYYTADFYDRIMYPEVNEGEMIDDMLFGFSPCYGNGCVTYVKKAWLDEAGIDISTVTDFDSYYAMLKAFKENGHYGVVAAGYYSEDAPYVNYLPEFWQDAYPGFLQDENDVWYDGFLTGETDEALQRIRRAVLEGVIDPATRTNTTSDARESWYSADQSKSAGVFTYWAGTWFQTLTDKLDQNNVDDELVELPPIAEVGAYLNREAPVWVIFDDQDGNEKREQAIFDKFIETMMDGGKVQMLWTYGAEGVHWSTSADEGFTTNAGTENEKVYGPYAEGEFHLLQSPSNSNEVWKKNYIDANLVICPLEGEYADYTSTSELAKKSSDFFINNMKNAPATPTGLEYNEHIDEINEAKKKAIDSVVVGGMKSSTALYIYRETVGDLVEEVLNELNTSD